MCFGSKGGGQQPVAPVQTPDNPPGEAWKDVDVEVENTKPKTGKLPADPPTETPGQPSVGPDYRI